MKRTMTIGRSVTGIIGTIGTRVNRLAALVALLLAFGVTSELHAHLALQSSAPAADEMLAVAPSVIRLTFTEPVELGLCTIVLTGPNGAVVATGPLETTDAREVITAAITGDLEAGTYSVAWQAVGRDGHPVRGDFAFVIEEDAEGLAIPSEEIPAFSTVPEPRPPPSAPTFSAQSPLYAGVRWINYLGIFGVIGAIGFSMLLSSPRVGAVPEGFRSTADHGAAVVGIFSGLVLAFSLALRMQAQSHALFGGGVTSERFSLLAGSGWGTAWLVQAVSMVVAVAGFLVARRGMRFGWIVAAAGALGLVVSPGMSGHAAAVDSFRLAAMASDALHILGVGLWLGTLLVLILVGIPAIRREPVGQRGALLEPLVRGFSPLALVAAGVVFATGVIAALFHLSALADLWTTGYGRLLSAKLLLVSIVIGFGALNWRRVAPRIGEPGGDGRLMKSAGAELVAATLIIGLTAVLVAVPPPDQARAATQTTPQTDAIALP